MQTESHSMARHNFLADEQTTPNSYLDLHTHSLMMWVVFFAPLVLAAFLVFAVMLLPVTYT